MEHIQGVTELNNYIYSTAGTGTIMLTIGAIMAAVGVIIIIQQLDFFTDWFLIFIGLVIILQGGLITKYGYGYLHYEVERYQITVDETVPLKQFNETYKIIETEGHIYTVEER